MSKVTEEDFIKVNAFHDGEMTEDCAAFAQRLETEPELKALLTEIGEVSASLKALKPQPAILAPARNDNRGLSRRFSRSRKLRLFGSALAASIALAVALSHTLHQPDEFAPDGPLAIHEMFSAQTFVAQDRVFQTISGEQLAAFPDLSAANLTLVAVRAVPLGMAAHFAGHEGCRLTVFSSAEPLTEAGSAPALQSAAWEVPDRRYRIVATGMDAGKFAAIAAYLKQATRKMAKPDTVIALKDATARATSCG
ncbi:hypothetical protein ACFPOD_17725 [Nitratireductor kimnyeongensis]|uniref:Transmembrane transcriptional regulator (Anti-sigma factor RsiW) n=1 Tax=Nitratireductor kimnyeongensis TaxID=430679 RepID=A0ABW0TE25_9HYPH|nr:hypothetical protein [Nitratireductor kimnyeongensis]QZZ37692.1 hypothetical protein KW403_19030 [Nitratireductor kimnyeongensis]